MRRNVGKGLKRFWGWIKGSRVQLLTVFGWTVTLLTMTVKSYWLLYIENPELVKYRLIITGVARWVPRLQAFDYIVFIAASVLAGAMLMEFRNVLVGWSASIFLSFIFSVICMFFYVWFSLGVGLTFAEAGIEDIMSSWVLLWVGLNVFRMWFPFVPVLTLITAFFGVLFRDLFVSLRAHPLGMHAYKGGGRD